MTQIPVSEDLSSFFVDGEFAQEAEVDGVIITAIVTDFYDALEGGTVGIEGAEVLLICKTSEVATVEHGTAVVIDTEEFVVSNVKPDNSGITRLQLARVL